MSSATDTNIDVDIADAITQILATYPDEPISEHRLWHLFKTNSKLGEKIAHMSYREQSELSTRFSVIFHTSQHLSEYVHPLHRNGNLNLIFSTNPRSKVIENWRDTSTWNNYFNTHSGSINSYEDDDLINPWKTLEYVLDNPHNYSSFSPHDTYHERDPVLHYIVRNSKSELLKKYLSNFNYEETLKNQDDDTALDIAIATKNNDIIRTLVNATLSVREHKHQTELNALKNCRENALIARNTANDAYERVANSRFSTFMWGVLGGVVLELGAYMWYNDYF